MLGTFSLITFLQEVRPTTWRVLALAIVAELGMGLLLAAALSNDRVGQTLGGLHALTNGLVHPLLITTLGILAPVLIVVFGLGRLRISDVGWQAADIPCGLVVAVEFWLAVQAALAAGRRRRHLAGRGHRDQRARGAPAGPEPGDDQRAHGL